MAKGPRYRAPERKKNASKATRNILVFYKTLPTYNPIKTIGHARKTATKRRDISEVYGDQTFTELPYDSTERYPLSVLPFSSDKQKENLHPTQKPLALTEYLVRTYSVPGDTVLDNCMGSNTTGLACKNLGRNFVGIEKDASIFKVAQQRTTEGKR